MHEVGAARKTAEYLLILIKQNLDEARRNYGVEWVGWCTDAGGDSHKARKLLFNELPELICPDCSAHLVRVSSHAYRSQLTCLYAIDEPSGGRLLQNQG